LTVPAQWAAVLAALLILGWEPLSVPVTFTTVGSTVAQHSQGMAFAIQSIQKRLPKILGPFIAGWVLAWTTHVLGSPQARTAAGDGRRAGPAAGMRILVAGSLLLGVTSLAVQLVWMPRRKPLLPGPSGLLILRGLHPTLKRLLVAEVFTRWCDWLVREFVVLY